jgi:hypothetical protein
MRKINNNGIANAVRKSTINTSISIEPGLLDNARTVARMVGYKHSLSAYVCDLILRDIECRMTRRVGAIDERKLCPSA